MRLRPRVGFIWTQMPVYAAKCLAQFKRDYKNDVMLLCRNPDAITDKSANIIEIDARINDNESRTTWQDVGLERPDFLFINGWSVRWVRSLVNEVNNAGGLSVAMADNIWHGSVKQRIACSGPGRLWLRPYHAFFVPGKASSEFLQRMNVAEDKIYPGLYGADGDVFFDDGCERIHASIVFAGQLIQRKGVDLLIEAFNRIRANRPDATLTMIGEGPLKGTDGYGITWRGWLDEAQLAHVLQRTSVFVLPSRLDHWGVVLHEAALCGCLLVASDSCGAAADLIKESNGISFRSGSTQDLQKALEQALEMEDAKNTNVQRETSRNARAFGPVFFSAQVQKIIEDFRARS
jgi:glycosyltransferase involved in cell wall biosynthesis